LYLWPSLHNTTHTIKTLNQIWVQTTNIYITHPHRNDSIEVDKRVDNLRTYIRKHRWWIQLTGQEPKLIIDQKQMMGFVK
jgi:hypothetical protein